MMIKKKQCFSTWNLHSIHTDFLNKVQQSKKLRHLSGGDVFTLPSANTYMLKGLAVVSGILTGGLFHYNTALLSKL